MQAITPHEIPGAVGDEWIAPVIDWPSFCKPHDLREHLREPWYENGFTYATNGASALAIRGIHTDITRSKDAASIVTPPDGLDWHSISDTDITWSEIPPYIRDKTCPACWRTGKAAYVACNNCPYPATPEECGCGNIEKHNSHTCPICYGHGLIYPDTSTLITDPLFDGMHFQSHLLLLFINFTNIELAASAKNHTLYLRFNEGIAAIASCRPDNHKPPGVAGRIDRTTPKEVMSEETI
ncbi:MAG: hypothetical protein OIF57_16825 [Marinobacterium sp.]|nr:hypothetical protein [Marinobacterium sp.]